MIKEYKTVLNQEEMIWFQKARTHWISEGENNTRYFHITALNKRRKNKINMLKINGSWTEDLNIIKQHINEYLLNLLVVLVILFVPTVINYLIQELIMEILMIYYVLFQMMK